MSVSSSAPESAGTVDSRNRVFVTGAGFTRALVPKAPLLVDDFGNDAIADRVHCLPNASRLFRWERDRHTGGRIDIERLMTRLASPMPYDFAGFAANAANEYALLLSELKRSFLKRIRETEQGEIHRNELRMFASYCAMKRCHCITFNYDDFLDQALSMTDQWTPGGGYGFHCPSSLEAVAHMDEGIGGSGLYLLKLHGSVNWWPKLGHTDPVPLDAITHHSDWSSFGGAVLPQVSHHLEPQPMIVPPVLSKSSLVEQPILRLVWSLAYKVLQSAHEVYFIGYSFPSTDIAARTMFFEALADLPREDLHIVNLPRDESHVEEIKTAYRNALGDIPDSQFQFDGALSWIQDLPT